MNPQLLTELGIDPQTMQLLQGMMAGQQKDQAQQRSAAQLMGNAQLMDELTKQGMNPSIAMLNALRQPQQPPPQQQS